MTKELEFLIRIVKEAGELVTDDIVVKAKENIYVGDLVTNFDFAIEQLLINQIKTMYPSFGIVSEEFNDKVALAKNCFVIDPIDGTINFAHGFPLWCIQVACVKNGETVASVIYMPRMNEMYYADENGAFLNGNKITVNKLSPEKCLYSINSHNPVPSIKRMSKHISPVYNRNFVSTGVSFAYTASGKLGGIAYQSSAVWDYMPGQYLVKQAGGYIYSGNSHIGANSLEFVELLKKETDSWKADK